MSYHAAIPSARSVAGAFGKFCADAIVCRGWVSMMKRIVTVCTLLRVRRVHCVHCGKERMQRCTVKQAFLNRFNGAGSENGAVGLSASHF
jgi:hypothetical protein